MKTAIISFEGPMGQGKTMDAVALLYTDMMQQHVKVISNIHLNEMYFPGYIYMDAQKLIEYLRQTGESEAEDCDILFDEAYQIMDSRASASKLNMLFADFILQTRKRSANLFVCFHNIDAVDKRLRRAIDYRGTCTMRNESPCAACDGDGYVLPNTKRLNERKLALYRNNGIVLPVSISSRNTYHGKITCNVKNLMTGERLKADESQLLTKNHVFDAEWHDAFDFILKTKDEDKVLCDRCLGYGETGWSTVRFRDLHYGTQPRSLRVFGPAVWPLYDTKERIPLTERQLRVEKEDL